MRLDADALRSNGVADPGPQADRIAGDAGGYEPSGVRSTGDVESRRTGAWTEGIGRLWDLVPGLAVLALVAAAATAMATGLASVSPLMLSVALAAVIGNCISIPARCAPGITFGSRSLLRAGVVLLGLRLSVTDLVSLGGRGLLGVALVVGCTFAGVQGLARALGVNKNVGLLVAAGYAICGASAVAAVNGVVDADEEEVAYAIALVTLCGSLSILMLPVIGDLMSLNPRQFGSWVGASVHDVGQVVATASHSGPEALQQATLVKLTRVVLLAPVVAAVSLRRRSPVTGKPARSTRVLVPAFVLGFLATMLLSSTGLLNDDVKSAGSEIEKLLFVLSLAGLGFGIRLDRLRILGGRPLMLGLSAWILVAAVAYAFTLAVERA